MDRVVLDRRGNERGLLSMELKKALGIWENEHALGQLWGKFISWWVAIWGKCDCTELGWGIWRLFKLGCSLGEWDKISLGVKGTSEILLSESFAHSPLAWLDSAEPASRIDLLNEELWEWGNPCFDKPSADSDAAQVWEPPASEVDKGES